MNNSTYLAHVFEPEILKKTSELARKQIRKFQKKYPFDTLVFTGVSGMSLGFILSRDLGIPVLLIRKSGERSHANGIIEGYCTGKSYLIVDDFVDTGSTIRRIVRRMNKIDGGPKCAGIFLHAPCMGNYCIVNGESAKEVDTRFPDVPIFGLRR